MQRTWGLSKQIGSDEVMKIISRESGRSSSMSFEQHSIVAKNMWSKPGMKRHLSNKRKEQNRMGKNPMQGKKQKRVCCLSCKKEMAINNFARHKCQFFCF